MYSFTNMKNSDFDISMNIHRTLNSIVSADIAKRAFREKDINKRKWEKIWKKKSVAMEEWLKGVWSDATRVTGEGW